jgi:predicted transcriptional regulator of viral defense system
LVLEDVDEIMAMHRRMASRVVQENEMELQMKVLEIVQSLVPNAQKQIQKAKILTVAEMEGIGYEQTTRILKTLEDMGYIKQVTPGYYKRT